MGRKTATEIIQGEKESEQNKVTLEDFYVDKKLLNTGKKTGDVAIPQSNTTAMLAKLRLTK